MFYIFHIFSVFPFGEAMKTFPQGYAPETEKCSLEKRKLPTTKHLFWAFSCEFSGVNFYYLPPRSFTWRKVTGPECGNLRQVSNISMGQLFYIMGHIQKLSAGTPSIRHMN